MEVEQPARLIIVDDEPVQTKALCDTLADEGFETAGFVSARAALDVMKSRRFDLLLADLSMPEMDGIALLRAAREIDHDLVGIIMTGEGTIATAVEAMKVGATDYILKPFKLSAILPVLSRALALRRLRIDNAALERALREHAARLETSNKELDAANKELDAFAHSVSHDLRGPLRAVLGFSGMLAERHGAEMTEPARDLLASTRRAGKRMDQLIEDLLGFARLGRQPLSKERVDLGALVKDVLNELRTATSERAADLRVGDLPDVMADRSLLRQVYANLVSNAFKFSAGRDQPVIEIGCEDQGGERVFFVRDNGAGFDMRYAAKLFGVFQRMHAQDEFPGTGVGLSLVQRIVNRHGGRIWAEAELGKGATFRFTLPELSGGPRPAGS
jgi:hypothetical protein